MPDSNHRKAGRQWLTASYQTIIYEVDGHTATITLNCPEALNALSPFMITESGPVYDAPRRATTIARLLIVTATGRLLHRRRCHRDPRGTAR